MTNIRYACLCLQLPSLCQDQTHSSDPWQWVLTHQRLWSKEYSNLLKSCQMILDLWKKKSKKTVKITSPDLLCSMQYQLPSLRLSCSTKLGSVVVLHSTVRWFLIIERKSCQNNFPGASLLSVQCTVHSVRASSAASVLFREVRQRVFCPPGQPWIHYFSLVLHQSFEFLWIQIVEQVEQRLSRFSWPIKR